MSWREWAACVGQPELFLTDAHLYQAQQICVCCPVINQCRTTRRQLEERTHRAHPGVWAGEYWTVRKITSVKARLST